MDAKMLDNIHRLEASIESARTTLTVPPTELVTINRSVLTHLCNRAEELIWRVQAQGESEARGDDATSQ